MSRNFQPYPSILASTRAVEEEGQLSHRVLYSTALTWGWSEFQLIRRVKEITFLDLVLRNILYSNFMQQQHFHIYLSISRLYSLFTLLQCNYSFTSANFPSPPSLSLPLPIRLLLSDSVFEQVVLARADKAESNVKKSEAKLRILGLPENLQIEAQFI